MTGFRITSITAYTAIGADDEEGVCAFLTPTGWMPMVAADDVRLVELRRHAQDVATMTGRPITVRRFDVGEVVEVIEP